MIFDILFRVVLLPRVFSWPSMVKNRLDEQYFVSRPTTLWNMGERWGGGIEHNNRKEIKRLEHKAIQISDHIHRISIQ